ncbi:MAG: PAS domain S-box protein [Sporomusaceae bacterium]|nr:PAS domain S-box protein [Sporomusaceae bacterium]
MDQDNVLWPDYGALYETMPISAFLLTETGEILAANSLGIEFMNQFAQEVPPGFFGGILSAKHRLAFQAYLEALFAGKEAVDCQLEIGNLENVCHVLLKSRVFFDVLLQKKLCHTFVIDITGYKRGQEEAVSEHKRLRRQIKQERNCHQREVLTLLDSLPALVFFKNLGCMYVMANQTFCDAVGYSLEEIIGKTDYDLFSAKRADKYRQDDLIVLREGRPLFIGEEEVIYGGISYSVITRKVPICDENDQVTGLIGLVFDIREMKEAEQDLRESEEKYRLLFSKEKDAIMLFDVAKDHFIDVNEAAVQLYGYTREELLQMCARDIYANLDGGSQELHLVNQCLMAVAPEQDSEQTAFHWHKKKDGTVFPVEIAAAPFTWKGRNMVCEIIRDISGQYKVEAELRRAKATAEQSNRMKSDFLAMVSHEIRTPMSGVLGMLDLLLKTKLNDTQKRMAEAAHLSAENLLVIINDVLDFSKIEADKITFSSLSFSLTNLLQDTLEMIRPMAMLKGLTFEYSCEDLAAHYFKGDPIRIKQILLNLLGNALKFTERGTIRLSVKQQEISCENVCLLFTVEDTGIGIADKDVQDLFQPFTQKESTSSRRYSGTGLGLAISKRLVELMNGKIGVTSQFGKGSAFWFTLCLPIALEEEPETTEAVLVAERPEEKASNDFACVRSNDYRILVAEDNPINQEIVLHYLETLQLEATAVNNGKECLELWRAGDYDLILLDCQMPEMDGFETARQIRRAEETQQNAIPIIAMTAYAMEGDRQICLAAGMDDYISKPLTAKQLEQILRRWLPGIGHVLEESVLRDLALGSGDDQGSLLHKLVCLFRERMPETVSEIERAKQTGDMTQLSYAVHSLKSASAHLGALRLADLCRQIEVSLQNEKLEKIPTLISHLPKEYELANRALQEWLNGAKTK